MTDHGAATTSSTDRQGRDRLLEVARRLFTEHGYASVSMQQIAEAAGMTKGAPYYHFANKEDLFRQVSTVILRQLHADLRQGIEGNAGEAGLRGHLESILHNVARTMSGEHATWFADFKNFISEADKNRIMHSVFDMQDAALMLVPLFEHYAAMGETLRVAPDVASRTFLLFAFSAADSAHEKAQLSSEAEFRHLVNQIVDIFLHGALTQPTP